MYYEMQLLSTITLVIVTTILLDLLIYLPYFKRHLNQ